MSEPLRILLTGATGLIGKEVGKALTEAGHAVVAVTRSKTKAQSELPFHAEIVEWDDQSPESLLAQSNLRPSEIDAVIHLMGENLAAHRWTPKIKQRLVESRVGSTIKLIAALTQPGQPSRLKSWIQGSAVGFYGERELFQPATEDTPKGQGFLADLCRDWEASTQGLPLSVRKVFIRTGIVLSHRGGTFQKLLPPILQGVGGRMGSGDQAMSLIHLEDEVGFIVHAVQTPAVEGAYNLVCDEPITQRQLMEKCCQRLHSHLGPPAPKPALKALFGEMADLLLQSLAVKSIRLGSSGYQLQYSTPDLILDEVTSWYQDPVSHQGACYLAAEEQFIPQGPEIVSSFFSARKKLEPHPHDRPWFPLWLHEYVFQAVKGGTLVQETIRYRFPLGKVGQWVGYLATQREIERLFDYRRKMVGKEFLSAARP